MIKSFYKDKRILVTGASGYIGYNLIQSLLDIKCDIFRVTRNKQKLKKANAKATLFDIELDYNDSNAWDGLLKNIDVVFYLAAQTSTYVANNNPVNDYQQNSLPLLYLLNSCKQNKFNPTIIFSSTATTIGLTDKLPVLNNVYESPETIYDIHKLTCEKYLRFYSNEENITSCSLRLANVYGPGIKSGSSERGILNMMIQRAMTNEPLTIYGDGKQIRDYIFIDDVINAFLFAAINIENTNAQHFNIAYGEGYSFVEVFNIISHCVKEKLGIKVEIIHIKAPENLSLIEYRNFIADISEYKSETGWKAEVDIETGINKTIEYYSQEV